MPEERNYLIHPYFIILFLVLAGVTALFIGFSAAYLYNRFQQNIPPIALPSLFYVNTLILILSSVTMYWSKRAYLDDDTQKFKVALMITMFLTILFLFAQIMAWMQLTSQDIFVNYNNMASYLYVISGLHFFHVVAGIPFLGHFIYEAQKNMKSPVSVLIYFSDPGKRRKLQLLNIYWHFLDGLWIYLVLFFLINYLLQ